MKQFQTHPNNTDHPRKQSRNTLVRVAVKRLGPHQAFRICGREEIAMCYRRPVPCEWDRRFFFTYLLLVLMPTGPKHWPKDIHKKRADNDEPTQNYQSESEGMVMIESLMDFPMH